MQVFCNRSNKLTKQKCIAFFQDKILTFNIRKSQEKRKCRSFFYWVSPEKFVLFIYNYSLQHEILKKFSFSFKDKWYETVYIFAAILTWKVTLHKLLEKSFHTSVFFFLVYFRQYRVFWNPESSIFGAIQLNTSLLHFTTLNDVKRLTAMSRKYPFRKFLFCSCK